MIRKTIAAICSLALTLSLVSMFCVSTYALTVSESEPNNSFSSADATTDDADHHGYISSSSDVDYWYYIPSYTGFTNIYLGNIPSGCDYDIYLYSNNNTLLACSEKPSNLSENMKCRLMVGVKYYIKVFSTSNYSTSQYYNLRVKNYTLGDAKMFVFQNIYLDTTLGASGSYSYLWSMGYTGTWYLNNVATPAYNVFPTSRIFYYNGHGEAGAMKFVHPLNGPSYIYGKNATGTNKAIYDYPSGNLSETRLAVFCGCQTGVTDPSSSAHNNLVDMALAKSAYCAIGWNQTIYSPDTSNWAIKFFEESANNKNVHDAMISADLYIQSINSDPMYYYAIRDRYIGTSRTESIIV